MWDECIADADGVIHAQWTAADFHSWVVCAAHYLDMAAVIVTRQVDGELPFDTWTVWWDDEGDYVEELPPRVLER